VRGPKIAIGAAGFLLGVVAYRILRDDLHQEVIRSLPVVAIGWSAIASGLIAWTRRPINRLGPLMIAYGLAVLIRPWQYSGDALMFTLGYALSQLNVALFGHTALAYPSGRVTDRLERAFVAVAYAFAAVMPLATLLVYDGSGLRYIPPGPESLLLVHAHVGIAHQLDRTFVLGGYGVLAAVFIALVARKLVRASVRMRRILAPLLLAALVAALRALTETALMFTSLPQFFASRLYWWQVAGQILLPITMLVGLLRARLARSHVGELVLELDHTPPEGVRDALAHHLGDPSLELFFWLPERGGYVDSAGAEAELPEPGSARSMTEISNDGERIAVIVHDRSLDDEPQLLQAAAAAARLALENARLHAQVRAQLVQVQESRRRIVTAGDEQRRRIERDIHDGAQQRLVALALELRATQRRLGGRVDPDASASSRARSRSSRWRCPSCASWRGASTRRSSRTRGSTVRSSRSRRARPSTSASTGCSRNGCHPRWRRRATSSPARLSPMRSSTRRRDTSGSAPCAATGSSWSRSRTTGAVAPIPQARACAGLRTGSRRWAAGSSSPMAPAAARA
jgi:signal transduction histidine kinase